MVIASIEGSNIPGASQVDCKGLALPRVVIVCHLLRESSKQEPQFIFGCVECMGTTPLPLPTHPCPPSWLFSTFSAQICVKTSDRAPAICDPAVPWCVCMSVRRALAGSVIALSLPALCSQWGFQIRLTFHVLREITPRPLAARSQCTLRAKSETKWVPGRFDHQLFTLVREDTNAICSVLSL